MFLSNELSDGESYLDKAYSTKESRHITKWANGAAGSLVDIENEYVLRFVDYYYKPGKDDDDDYWRKIHPKTEDELTCPVVAEGIVVFWLKYRNQNNIAQIFEDYYDFCLQQYIKKEEKSMDAWERDLPREFAKGRHLKKELKRIEKSEAIYPYLDEKDVGVIKQLTNNYINFVRKKGKDLYPPQYTKGSEKIEAFLYTYETTARWCVDWICDEYNLPPMGPLHGDGGLKKEKNQDWYFRQHFKIETRYIRWGFQDFERRDIYYKNSEMMEQINVNLNNLPNREARIRYVIKLLSSFKEFAEPFYPMGRIKEWEQSIEEHKKCKSDWEKVADDAVDEETGKPLNPKKQMEACESFIESMKADIKYWNEKARKLYDICQEAIADNKRDEEVPIEYCLEVFWSTMIHFYRRLTALLLTYKIKLMDVQKMCGVYLNWCADLTDYVDEKYVPNYDYAKQLLSEIEKENQQTNNEESYQNEGHRKTDIFDPRLNEKKIAAAIKKLDRKGLGDIKFTFAVHNCLESLNWLVDSMDTHFVAWMKKRRLIKMKTKDLKQAAEESRTKEVEDSLLDVFQETNEETGLPKDKIEFYNRIDAKLINDGR